VMSEELRVVLVEPKYEGNIGMVARIMHNFSFSNLVLVNPQVSIGEEAYAYSMHGESILRNARIFTSLEAALEGSDAIIGTSAKLNYGGRNVFRTAITPRELSSFLAKYSSPAILFGREDFGLPKKVLDSCDILVKIPSNPKYPTLNLAVSVGIILYELFLSRRRPRKNIRDAPNSSILNQLIKEFDTLVDFSGIPPHKIRYSKKAFRNILCRSYPSKRETTLLLGVLRHIRETIQSGGEKDGDKSPASGRSSI